MENFKAMYQIFILLELVAFHEILSIEGRQLKSITEKREGSQSLNSIDYSPQHHDPATSPSHIPSTEARKKEVFPPITPKKYSFNFHETDATYRKDFRPTTPGNSPGVGHSFSNQEADMESKVVNKGNKSPGTTTHSLTEFKDDFRPTSPGHSPGIGHVLQHKSAEPNA